MDLKIEINADEVQKQVTDAILKSAIGKQIEVAVTDALKGSSGFGRENLVQRAVNEVLMQQIRFIANDVVNEKRNIIREQMLERLTDSAINDLTNKLWDLLDRKLSD